MARKRKSKRRASKANRRNWWSAMEPERKRRLLGIGAITVTVVVIALAGFLGLTRLEAHVDRLILAERPRATFEFTDLPGQLVGLADGDLERALSDLRSRDWTDDHLCEEMADRLGAVGWVAKVNFVRRSGAGRFEISARYRQPTALVQQSGDFIMVDSEAVRLPGRYTYDPTWRIVQGVAAPAPKVGTAWGGEDLRAGLSILKAIVHEPFGHQITAVLVDNFGGRRDPRGSHIELATDRAGGRIRWGSAPGLELEENLTEQKLALLRENYGKTGRADARHPVIDVSTFPDRYTIPG